MRFSQPLDDIRIETVRAALVIGAGPAGLRAAIALADVGLAVHVVEKEMRRRSPSRIAGRWKDAKRRPAWPSIARIIAYSARAKSRRWSRPQCRLPKEKLIAGSASHLAIGGELLENEIGPQPRQLLYTDLGDSVAGTLKTMTQTSIFEKIAAEFPEIAAIYLFGSLARGEETERSDADLGVVLRGKASPPDWRWRGRLAAHLEELFPGRTTDLVVLDEQGPLFRHQVLQEGRLLYEGDRDRRIDFESSTYVEAFDFLPTWRIATEGRIEAIRRGLTEGKR